MRDFIYIHKDSHIVYLNNYYEMVRYYDKKKEDFVPETLVPGLPEVIPFVDARTNSVILYNRKDQKITRKQNLAFKESEN